jgi:two-component system, cell cycle sensor histidine kinase and response regulator CckA
VPLVFGSAVVGVLAVAYRDEHRFEPAELSLLDRFGQLASLALENARLHEAAQRELDERRQAEEALRKSQGLYRAIVDNSTDVFTLLGLDEKVLYVSPAHRRLLGYEPDEVVGRQALDFVHPDDAEAVSANMAATLRGEKTERDSVRRVRHKDGHWILMDGVVSMVEDEYGRPEMVLAMARDVTEQHRQQEFLATTQELYRTVVDNSRDLILLLDLVGSVQFSSPSGQAILGYERDELAGVSWFDLLHPDDVEMVRSFVFESLRSGTSGAYVARVRHKDGSWIEMEGIPAPVLENGRMVAILGVARDVSERRRAEEERAALAEQLRQSQKMEAIGQLAGGIAHDFNNLLTAITGYGDLALGRLDAGSPVRRNVEEMKRAGERAAVLTRQLLAFSRKQVLQPKVLDLNDVVCDLERMLGRVLGEHVELVTALAADLGRTRADPGQIEQVVMNLAINARDAMPTGGKLTLSTENVELDELFVTRHHGAVAGQYVMLAVSDTGEGMDRKTLERVFDPFFTTKPQGQGTGLGLSTVYGIVKQTGGQIWAYAEPGQGATFKVYLPRVWERAAERAERAAAPRLLGTETVLLVEDEAIVRDLVHEMLETAGYRVLEAPSGADAIAIAAAYKEPIDLLVTDVVMPAMSGQELAARLLAERPELRVLFTSGYTEDAITSHGVLAPGTAFAEKPFTAAELGQKVRDLLDRRPEADLREAV